MMRRLATLVAMLLLIAAPAWAQDGSIEGQVTDAESGEPIPGVNIVLTEADLGTATDAEGRYVITQVPPGTHTLAASFIGYETYRATIEVAAGEALRHNIRLVPDVVALQDVVVTALGIERTERSLGYSVQEIDAAALDRVPETNFVDALSGKIAGAQFNQSNSMGGSTRIVLRGATSIAGNNQPLFVVDGVVLDNSNFTSTNQARGVGGYDYGNAAQMINPNDIESVSVLKGASAAALYGSRAANGVIQIRTRSGQGVQGSTVTFNTGVTFNQVYNLPNYQNEYGGGAYNPFSQNDQGQLVADFATDQSWGPRLDGREVRQWYSFDDVNGLLGQATPWVAAPNNVRDFFDTGTTVNTTVAFAQNSTNFNYRLSLTNFNQADVFPNSGLQRNQISFNGTLNLTDRLTTALSASYVKSDVHGRPGTGYDGSNVFQQFNHFGQRQIDLGPNSFMADYARSDGTQRGWNWRSPTAGTLAYFDNPYWVRHENFQNDDTDRIFGNLQVTYRFTDDLQLTAEARNDYYADRREERVATGTRLAGLGLDFYQEGVREVQETSGQLTLRYDSDLSRDISLNSFAATEYRHNNYFRNVVSTAGGLSAPNVFNLENSTSRPVIDDYFQEQAVFGVFASATVGFQDIWYIDGTLRNDWSSTLPEGENSYLYPSVGTSVVFSELGPFANSDILSFGKIRASWSQVGSDTDPYRLSLTYPLATPYGNLPLQSLPNTLPNADLRPEITTSWEVGAELQFFRNRLGLDVTYYDASSRNQIVAVEVSRASGYVQQLINAGELANRGVELELNATPYQTRDFQWNLNVNWARNVNELVELAEGLSTYTLGTAPFGPTITARVGETYGNMRGTTFLRDENGNKIIRSNGTYAVGPVEDLGSYVPDWTGGIGSTFSYRGVSASFLIDGQRGGNIWSVTNLFGLYSGIMEETVAGNVREVGLIPEGVTEDGEVWTQRVDPNTLFTGLFGLHEAHVFDASFARLRELSIGYTMPQRWFVGTPVQGLTVSAIGRNLGLLYKNTPNFDPTTALSAGNLQGIEAGQNPPQRSLGFNVRLTL